jgi:hypothetical protein
VNLQAVANMVWVAVYRHSPLSATALRQVLPADPALLTQAIEVLLGDGRVQRHERDGEVTYLCEQCYVPPGTPGGWEAAVFDHYQAVVTTICSKLMLSDRDAPEADEVGASTFRYDVWADHPLRGEVVTMLGRVREQMRDLRRRVEEHNASVAAPDEAKVEHHLAYVGQTRLLDE